MSFISYKFFSKENHVNVKNNKYLFGKKENEKKFTEKKTTENLINFKVNEPVFT